MKRLPQFGKKNQKKIAEIRCKEIANTLTDYYSGNNKPGWMNGLIGISCFFFHYFRYTGNKTYRSHAYYCLEKVFQEIEKGFSDPSFSGGLAGVQWLLHYLGENDFINQDEALILDNLKPMFLSYAREQFNNNNWDYLHGALGTYNTIINDNSGTEHYKPSYPNELNSLIKNELFRLSKKNQDGLVYWESLDYLTRKNEINLGLAHGIPSILIVLSKIYKQTQDNSILEELIKPGMEYLTNHRKLENSLSQFPSRIVEGAGRWPSRMAWCYGDPGIGLALMQIGDNCSMPKWKSLGLEILETASIRRSRNDSIVTDACLCHGSSGLALIYYYAAKEADIKNFIDTAWFWARETINYGNNIKCPGSYIFHTAKDQYASRYNVLEGIAGVGLFLITMLEGEKPGWGEGLLFQ